MKTRQLLLTAVAIFVTAGILSAIAFGSKNKKETTQPSNNNQIIDKTPLPISQASDTPIFFYGNTCPHCADVEAWMEENKIEEKISITKKEVYDNRQNAQELTKAAQSCNIPTNNIGVPFLYTPEGECLIGTPDIINYLRIKAGLSAENQATESGKESGL